MNVPAVPVGFDYAKAVLEILRVKTYEDVAAYLGYESVGAISRILGGSVPSHPIGEAIFVLYRELFGRKPPMTTEQATGVYDLHLSASQRKSAAA